MPELAHILLTCDAYTQPEHQRKHFQKVLCLIKRPDRYILGVYSYRHGKVIPGPIEYRLDDLLEDFPHEGPLCIDAGGRNHGVECPVMLTEHDINQAIIRASMHTDVAMHALRRELS
jgi:hypothetical protein